MKRILNILIGTVVLASSASASITINMFAGQLLNPSANGGIAAGGTLIQLINLGADGIFNPIDLNDGTPDGLARWVSGDDSLINVPFGSPDFASAAGFDFNDGPDGSAGAGTIDRVFVLALGAVPAGNKIGIRWFPGLTATNFSNLNAANGLANGQNYGQFSRLSNPQNGGEIWAMPNDGANVGFDPFATAGIGGPDSNSAGAADFKVVPEPASIALSLFGAAGLAMLRRRRG